MNPEVHTCDIRRSHQLFGEIVGSAGPCGFFRRLCQTRADGGIGQNLTLGAGIQPDDMPAKAAADRGGADLAGVQLAQSSLELGHALAGQQLAQLSAIGPGGAIADLFRQMAKGLGIRRHGDMDRRGAQMGCVTASGSVGSAAHRICDASHRGGER